MRPRHAGVLAAIALLVSCTVAAEGPSSDGSGSGSESGPVTHIVDGDTIDVEVDGEEVRVRLVGIDTPEVYNGTECGGPQASASLGRLLPLGMEVDLVRDPTQDDIDRYDRLLRYVEISSTGEDVNRTLVARGWARVYVYDVPFERVDGYREAERVAKDEQRGVWGRCR